jgi:3'(2'), 5'-bisphosphate nucleotidase
VNHASDDHRLAAGLAAEAGALLLGLRTRLGDVGSEKLRAEGDRRSHELLVGRLAELRAEDAVLSEEGVDDQARLGSHRVWIVDPLDGTREYGEGRADWAVHVALVVDGVPSVGAVSLPGLSQTLSTDPAPTVPARAAGGRVRLAVSRSRPPAVATAIGLALDAELVPMGSAGYKAMAVVRGEVDVYAHAGGQYEWDSAAPVAVALAAGLHASRLDGSPLRYNRPDPWLPDLLICRSELAGIVVEAASAAPAAPDD